MYRGKSSSLFFRFAVPQMIGLLFNSVYLIVDGVFIGNRLGRDAMAAAAVSVPFIEILIAISMAVASGAGIVISNCLGARRTDEANRTFNLAIALLASIGAVIVIIGNVFIDGLASALGATPEIREAAVSYLWYIVTFSPFLLFSFLLGGLARNDGRPKLAMFALAFGSVSNIVLDYVFMYPMNMGIAGAALATALGPIFSVIILLPHFLLKKGNLFFNRFQIRLKEIGRIFTLGFPSFIMEFTIGIITFFYNFAIVRNGYGELGLAAYLIIGYIMLIVLTVFLGLSEGLQPVFSYLNGRGEEERLQSLLAFSIKAVLLTGVLCLALILAFSRGFISIFAPGDIELIEFTNSKCGYYFSGTIFAGFNILTISYLQAVKKTTQALPVSLLRSVVLPPAFIMLLPALFGSGSIWICYSLGEVLTAVLAIVFSRLDIGRRHFQPRQSLSEYPHESSGKQHGQQRPDAY